MITDADDDDDGDMMIKNENGVGIVTMWLAINLLTKREKGHQSLLLRKAEKAEQKETMMARWRQAQMILMAECLR